MERVNYYQNKIQEVLTEYLADLRQPANQDIDFIPVSDKEKNHFQIIAMGWVPMGGAAPPRIIAMGWVPM